MDSTHLNLVISCLKEQYLMFGGGLTWVEIQDELSTVKLAVAEADLARHPRVDVLEHVYYFKPFYRVSTAQDVEDLIRKNEFVKYGAISLARLEESILNAKNIVDSLDRVQQVEGKDGAIFLYYDHFGVDIDEQIVGFWNTADTSCVRDEVVVEKIKETRKGSSRRINIKTNTHVKELLQDYQEPIKQQASKRCSKR